MCREIRKEYVVEEYNYNKGFIAALLVTQAITESEYAELNDLNLDSLAEATK